MELNYEYLIISLSFFILIVYIIVPTPRILFKLNDEEINKCKTSK